MDLTSERSTNSLQRHQLTSEFVAAPTHPPEFLEKVTFPFILKIPPSRPSPNLKWKPRFQICVLGCLFLVMTWLIRTCSACPMPDSSRGGTKNKGQWKGKVWKTRESSFIYFQERKIRGHLFLFHLFIPHSTGERSLQRELSGWGHPSPPTEIILMCQREKILSHKLSPPTLRELGLTLGSHIHFIWKGWK